MRVLAVSDEVDDKAYQSSLRDRYGHIDLVLGCGDLPYDYLDYIATQLGAPLFAVHGNHDIPPEQVDDPEIGVWWRGIDLHGRVRNIGGLLVAGLGGSGKYSQGPYQLSEGDTWITLLRMVPGLIVNRIARGRYLDVLVTHAPPRGIHDGPDLPHRGFGALPWFLRTFRPRYHLHGHSHVYDRRTVTRTQYHDTQVINVFGVREIELDAGR